MGDAGHVELVGVRVRDDENDCEVWYLDDRSVSHAVTRGEREVWKSYYLAQSCKSRQECWRSFSLTINVIKDQDIFLLAFQQPLQLNDKRADAFASSVHRSSRVSQTFLNFGKSPLEQMSCCYAFFRLHNGAWGVNRLKEGIDGQGFACGFWAVEYYGWGTWKVRLRLSMSY